MPAWSMGTANRGKSATTTPMTTPGPGSYGAITGGQKPGPKWSYFSLGKASRDNAYKTTSGSPGPGAYEQRSRIEGPKAVIAGRHTQSVSNLVPGPGQYNPDPKVRQTATTFKYSMGGRPASAIKESGAPGPGAYDTKVAKEKIGARFGKDSRKPLSQSFNQFVPGPGAYESVSSAAKRYGGHQYTFGQKLSSGKAEAAAPGPGAYNTKSTIGAGGVKPSISGRRPDTAASYSSYVPGPGAYSPSAPKGGMPAYRVGTAQRTRHDKEAGFVPGPGAYNPMDKIAKSTTPGWGMGSGKRGGLAQATDTPGPGSYQPPGKVGEGPKYGLRPKTAVVIRNEVPGPGQYSPTKNPISARPPTATMGKGQRGIGFTGSKEVPGPGAYTQPGTIKGGPAFSFGTGKSVQHTSDIPGPGAYKVPSTISNLPNYAISQKSKEFQYI